MPTSLNVIDKKVTFQCGFVDGYKHTPNNDREVVVLENNDSPNLDVGFFNNSLRVWMVLVDKKLRTYKEVNKVFAWTEFSHMNEGVTKSLNADNK